MVHKFGYRSVFLATTSPIVVAQTKSYPDLTWLMQRVERKSYEHSRGRIEEQLESGAIDGKVEMLNYLTDVELLSSTHGLVGNMTSSVVRLALLLMRLQLDRLLLFLLLRLGVLHLSLLLRLPTLTLL